LDLSSGSIGTSSDPLEIDTTATTAAVAASGPAGVFLTELTDEFTLSSITTTGGDIGLVVRDASGSGQNLFLDAGQIINANEGAVTLDIRGNRFHPSTGSGRWRHAARFRSDFPG